MAIKDIYESQEHRANPSYFSAISNLASNDGKLNKEELESLLRFSDKLNITPEEYEHILAHPMLYPIRAVHSSEERLERIFDLFKVVCVDHYMDETEQKLILKYAIAMGCTSEKAESIIKKSVRIFEGGLDFEDYRFLLDKK